MNISIQKSPFLKSFLLLVLLCGQLFSGGVAAYAEGETPESLEIPEQSVNVDLPDTLTVKTGYANWSPENYEEVKSIPLSELETMDQYLSDYTFIDEEGRLLIVRAQGVLLTDLLMMTGIEIEDVDFLHFLSETLEEDRMVSFSKEELLETVRYCNYSLVNYYDEETGTLAEHKRWMAEPTEVMIAFQDCWIPAVEGGNFEEDCEELLCPWNRYRLMFGQTDCLERDADRAAGGVHTILVQLSGEPPEEPDTFPSGENADVGQSEEGSLIETPENGDKPEKEGLSTGTKESSEDLSGEEPPQSTTVEPPEEIKNAVIEPVAESAGYSADKIAIPEENPPSEDAAVPLRIRLKENEPAPAVNKGIPELSFSEKPSRQETSRRLPSAEPLVTFSEETSAASLETEAGSVPSAAEGPEKKPSEERQEEREIQKLPDEQSEDGLTETTGTEIPSKAEEIEETTEPPAFSLSETEMVTYGKTGNTSLQSRNSQKTVSPSKSEKTEQDREGSPTLERVLLSTISGNDGAFKGELIRIGDMPTDAAEPEPAEVQPSVPAEWLLPEIPLAESDAAPHLIPVVLLDDTDTAADNPLLAPVKFAELVLLLLGGLIQYIHYRKEMEPYHAPRPQKAGASWSTENDDREMQFEYNPS